MEKQILQMRSALFWDITHRRVVILYRRFGATYRYVLVTRGLEVLEGKRPGWGGYSPGEGGNYWQLLSLRKYLSSFKLQLINGLPVFWRSMYFGRSFFTDISRHKIGRVQLKLDGTR